MPVTIEGMPKVRPSCVYCGKPRRPTFERVDAKKVFSGWHGAGHFCTLRCAAAFGNHMINRRAPDV